MSNDRWLVVHDQKLYPAVWEFDCEEDAEEKFNKYITKLMKGDTLYICEIKRIAEVKTSVG